MIEADLRTLGAFPNELLFAALQAVAEGVVITDASEKILWVNEAFVRLTGFSAQEALGQTPKIVQSGYHGPAFYAAMWRRLQAGLNWQGIVMNRRSDGSLYQEELSITPLMNAAGETTHYIAIKRDVTERQNLTAKLEESEKQFRRLFEGSPIACYETDSLGIARRANRVWCRLLGYSVEEVVGRPLWDFVDPAEREHVREMALTSLRDETVTPMVERIYVTRSGVRLSMEEHQTLEYGPDGCPTGISSALIDTTERAKAQLDLEESNLRYESLFVNSVDPIFVIGVKPGPAFVLEDVNPAWERLTGLQRSAVVSKTPCEVLNSAQADEVVARYRTCLERGSPITYEEELQFPRGIAFSQTHLAPIADASGKISRLAGFSRDLTSRHQMEAELRSKEELLRLVLDASRDGFWDWDVAKDRIQVSRRWAEILERSPDNLEICSAEFFSIVHPEDIDLVRQSGHLGQPHDRQSFNIEHRLKTGTGAWKWILARGRVVERDEAGAPLRVVGTYTDIADRKLDEERLRDSEERYRTVVAALAEGILVQDNQGRVQTCNAAAARILGISEEQLKQRTLGGKEWSAIHPDGTPFPAEERPSLVTLRTGKPCLGVIFGLPRSDGSAKWLSINSEPLFRAGENVPNGVVSSFTDITAERQNLAELEAARLAAEAATRAKSEFLACMSHEIRTPMNGVLGMLELLLDSSLTEEQREFAECIQLSGDALISIINDILDFSKVETGNVKLESIPFELRTCVMDVATLLRSNAAKKSLTLNFTFSDELAPAYVGDPGRVRQIVMNLAGNAVKFTHKGEVHVEVQPAAEEPGVVIRVHDTGIGIPPDYLPNLFTMFSQADRTTARRYGGTGLGLAISKQLIDLMGGKIEVSSAPDQGSTFTVTLPLERLDLT